MGERISQALGTMIQKPSPEVSSRIVARGSDVWARYQESHDVSHLRGQVAAVDPESRNVWIGVEAVEAIDEMNANGFDTPVYMVMVGYDYLTVKGKPPYPTPLGWTEVDV